MVASVVMILSAQLYCLTAASTPSGMDTIIVTTSDVSISSSVNGIRSKIFSTTGRPSTNE